MIKKCEKCNCKINDNSKFCSNCGCKIFNKNKRNGLIIIFCLFLIIGVPIISFIMSYTPKKIITAQEFEKIMTQQKCEVMKQIDNNNITHYYVKQDSICKYNIKYMKIDDVDIQNHYFHSFVKEVESKNIGVNEIMKVNDSFNKYYEFYIKNDYSTIFVSNKNTIIYGYVDVSLEKEFLALMSEMGYHEQENYNSTTSLLNIVLFTYITIFIIIFTISFWKLNEKFDKPGWYSLIPIYNIYILIKLITGKGWNFIFILLPIINFIFYIYLIVKLVKKLNKDGSYIVLLLLFPIIFLPMLAFEK